MSENRVKVRVDPGFFKFLDSKETNKFGRQDITYFAENGYCNLMQTSGAYGHLLVAIDDVLHVIHENTLFQLVENQNLTDHPKIRMGGKIKFLQIVDDDVYV